MDILATCLSGIIVKVYDDLTENNIIQDGFLKECLHTLSCFLLASSSANDFTYAIMQYTINLANNFANSKAFSEHKEKSILYMYPVFLFLSLNTIRQLNIIELLVLIVASLLSFGEASSINEEISVRKLIMRLGMSCVIVLGMFLLGYFKFLTTSLLKLCLFGLLYLLTSSGFQSYELFFKHIKVGINFSETPFKNIMPYMASNIA
jgi:hypothetical protein